MEIPMSVAIETQTSLEKYFSTFRAEVIGDGETIETPFGQHRLIYADWTASGRMYRPIEDRLSREIAPFVANTHTETNTTGRAMTHAYHKARQIIKSHVGAWETDVLISANSGMTGVVNKFQRILGLRVHERYHQAVLPSGTDRPIVFVSHMEHHSNQTSWLETLADVEIIQPTADGLVDLDSLRSLLARYADRTIKIAAVTSCSNVTGIKTPYHEIAEMMHRAGGLCFVDFACSAPYIDICMRPENPLQHLDAIYFSPHKFLGGPGATGILVFDPKLYSNRIPDNPGGGTVDWTNPWGEHKYLDEIEAREDGGTPAFLQTIRCALSIRLKEEMGVDRILERERELLEIIFPRLHAIPNLHVLAGQHEDRLGVISFYIEGLHYNLGVKLLNDRFGIQTRGGCSCAGTYGHYLLEVSQEYSSSITDLINRGDQSSKPGWIRMSIHPVMPTEDVIYILDALEALSAHFREWAEDYTYHNQSNEFTFNGKDHFEEEIVEDWFTRSLS